MPAVDPFLAPAAAVGRGASTEAAVPLAVLGTRSAAVAVAANAVGRERAGDVLPFGVASDRGRRGLLVRAGDEAGARPDRLGESLRARLADIVRCRANPAKRETGSG